MHGAGKWLYDWALIKGNPRRSSKTIESSAQRLSCAGMSEHRVRGDAWAPIDYDNRHASRCNRICTAIAGSSSFHVIKPILRLQNPIRFRREVS